MKSCILTVIKNEHEYLDEWIRYHLELGIEHIFIFEDIDSTSHQKITNKYPHNVSLDSIRTVLSEEDLQKCIQYKNTKTGESSQTIYFRKALSYIKQSSLNSYDWCFVIDIDEFITLENKDYSLIDVVSLYNDYDAFVMQWECYGANGLINKPDYNEKGVVETYTEKIKGYVPVVTPKSLTKSCYNLTRYREEYFGYPHQPSARCNCCRTDFSKNMLAKNIYNNIYVRHYITRSWEEYLWKKITRGYFYGKVRTLDAFFQMNPDMLMLKRKLMPSKHKPAEALVILTYSQRGAQGDELRLALKSWKKFCRFTCEFAVIGSFDRSLLDEFNDIIFIPLMDMEKKEGQYTPCLDVQRKMEIAYNIFHDKYAGFIWMVDDNYAIKPFTFDDIATIHYHSKSFKGNKDAPTSYWSHDKWKTRELLDKEGLPCVNYTSHFPCYFEFDKLIELWDKYNLREESYLIEDIYFNSFEHESLILDSNIRLGVWSYEIYKNEFEKAVNDPNIKFVCNSVEGWSRDLERSLMQIIEN